VPKNNITTAAKETAELKNHL